MALRQLVIAPGRLPLPCFFCVVSMLHPALRHRLTRDAMLRAEAHSFLRRLNPFRVLQSCGPEFEEARVEPESHRLRYCNPC
jgi:hypothetical protein